MKTRNFFTCGLLFAVLISLGSSNNAFAQNNVIKSDTLTLDAAKDSLGFALQDFGSAGSPIQNGTSVCHTIYFRNSSNEALIVQFTTVDGPLTSKTIPAIPFIMLPNEIVSLAELCFTPQDPTTTEVDGRFYIVSKIGSINYDIGASVKCFQAIDTLVNKPCAVGTIDADWFGPIIIDGNVTHTITMTSNRHTTIFVRKELGPDSTKPFVISGITFPYKLAPLEVKTFNVTFSPRSNTPVVQYRYVGDLHLFYDNCSESNFTLAGVAIPPTADSISTALAAGSTDVLAMIGDNSVTTKTFHFKNTGTTNLKITGVALKNGKSFAITDIQPSNTLPFTLTPGQSMSVTVSMTTVSNGVYYDEVIITAEQGIISMDFQLQGLRTNSLGVSDGSSQSEHVMLYPNPSHGGVTIALPGIHNAKIQVLNLLGQVIATATASEKWVWNSTEPAGTYILHVSGTDAAGKSFQSYDRFVINK